MPEALVVPGLVCIDPGLWSGTGDADLVRGPLAGKASLPEIEDWKQEIWLLPREVAARRGAPPPEARLTLDAYPRVAARLAEARLVIAEERLATAALAAGERVIFLAYHRVSGGGGLTVHGPEGARGFSAEDASLTRLALGLGDDEDEPEDAPSAARLYDRILGALTGGEASMLDVDLADTARRLPASELLSHEVELEQIEAQAAPRRAQAEALLAALDAASSDTVTLPGGYRARRVRERAFTLRGDEDVTVTGGPISVPAGARWVVEGVSDFTPPERAARRDRLLGALTQDRVRRASTARWGVALGALAVLGLAIAALLLR